MQPFKLPIFVALSLVLGAQAVSLPKEGSSAQSLTQRAQSVPTETLACTDVNWPIQDGETGTWVNDTGVSGISRYKLYHNSRRQFLYRFKLDFVNTEGWSWSFTDKTGKKSTVSTIRNGEQSFKFDSDDPNIVKVCKLA